MALHISARLVLFLENEAGQARIEWVTTDGEGGAGEP